MNKRIKRALSEMGMTEKVVFTFKELETIAEKADCMVIDVMWYLRHIR